MQRSLPIAGERTWIRQRRWRIERVAHEGLVARLDVSAAGRRRTFLAPFDRPVGAARAGRFRRASPRHTLARLAAVAGGAFGERTLASALDADVEILPHQLEPALALLGGTRRVLLADEVGLGKTIQAGIAIAGIVRRQAAARILVLVPAALGDQWRDELGRRFGLACLAADRDTLEAMAHRVAPGDNPWLRAGVWLASLDYVKQPHVLESLPPCPWDLVVVDEAHTVWGDSDRPLACPLISTKARQVLLLTATPHDGDEVRFRRLLELGALPRVPDPIAIVRRSQRDLRSRPPRRIHWRRVKMSAAERRLLDALGDFERAVLGAAGAGRREVACLLLSIFRKRALSTIGALAASLRRRLAWLERSEDAPDAGPHQCALTFDDADALGLEKAEAEGLMVDVGLDGRRERAWIRRVLVLADAAQREESKVARVAALIARVKEPMVVFTEFRDSLDVLRRHVTRRVPASCLHGGLSPVERRAELARFLEGATSALLATDVASLGLNLQSRARSVINLDLPWNPVRLEQRAGRVDRIGQRRRVHVTMLLADHDAEAPVLVRLSRRILTAARSTGGDFGYATTFHEAGVRASVFLGGAAVGTESAAPPPLTTRWARPARRVAARLLRCRALRRHWRAPADERARPRLSHLDRLPALRSLTDGALVIFTVPLVTSAGTTVEGHVVAVTIGAWSAEGRAMKSLIEHARRDACAALGPRARRLARRLAASAATAAVRERALGAWLIDTHNPIEAQAGLFDRRERRAFEKRRAIVDDIRRDVERRVADMALDAQIEIGPPSLVLALTRRR
ncbi:MAG: helicase-related protein [Vicinamibacterales bacterium]